jgi:hypothetical protein
VPLVVSSPPCAHPPDAPPPLSSDCNTDAETESSDSFRIRLARPSQKSKDALHCLSAHGTGDQVRGKNGQERGFSWAGAMGTLSPLRPRSRSRGMALGLAGGGDARHWRVTEERLLDGDEERRLR